MNEAWNELFPEGCPGDENTKIDIENEFHLNTLIEAAKERT